MSFRAEQEILNSPLTAIRRRGGVLRPIVRQGGCTPPFLTPSQPREYMASSSRSKKAVTIDAPLFLTFILLASGDRLGAVCHLAAQGMDVVIDGEKRADVNHKAHQPGAGANNQNRTP